MFLKKQHATLSQSEQGYDPLGVRGIVFVCNPQPLFPCFLLILVCCDIYGHQSLGSCCISQ